jgi:hypothetical protein
MPDDLKIKAGKVAPKKSGKNTCQFQARTRCFKALKSVKFDLTAIRAAANTN